jgi:hypothetical protein
VEMNSFRHPKIHSEVLVKEWVDFLASKDSKTSSNRRVSSKDKVHSEIYLMNLRSSSEDLRVKKDREEDKLDLNVVKILS